MTDTTPPPDYAGRALAEMVRRLALALGHITPQATSFHGNAGQLVTDIIAQRDQAQAIVEALKAKVAEQQAEITQLHEAVASAAAIMRIGSATTAGPAASTCSICGALVYGREVFEDGAPAPFKMGWTHAATPAEPHSAAVTPIVWDIDGAPVETWPLPPKWSRPDS